MRDLTLTQSARAARNAGSIAQADAGAGNSAIKLYTAQGGTLLAVRQLAKPCGTVRPADGRIQLTADTANDVVAATGVAAWGEWVAADGTTVLAAGPVTDEDGNVSDGVGGLTPTGDVGPWVLQGTTGTLLYEGGLVLLNTGLIG
ncbi:hypothetical protein [Diaphorobacter sp.]|uniref:hypothetical protein n=1 Tax=Diaphorobacter sp. TaxID=1934310 RepID=UPI00258A8BEB|nr:hypothetical protein [Diaphorobacter sp.]